MLTADQKRALLLKKQNDPYSEKVVLKSEITSLVATVVLAYLAHSKVKMNYDQLSALVLPLLCLSFFCTLFFLWNRKAKERRAIANLTDSEVEIEFSKDEEENRKIFKEKNPNHSLEFGTAERERREREDRRLQMFSFN